MKRLFVLSICSFVFFGLLKSPAFADCSIANFDENSRNLQVCVGQFATIEDLRRTTASFNCVTNSNGGICRGISGPTTYSLANLPDDQIAGSPGSYYTCIMATNINRAIGSINVSFSGGTTCTTATIDTVPGDWNMFEEGLPWQEGTNDPIKKGGIFCPDGTSVSTALGCIQTSDPNGFIAAILRIATGIGGGLALMMILYGVFIVTTSAGIPDKLKMGSEIITSAVIGLIFILLSIFLVNLIGINILGIPGLS